MSLRWAPRLPGSKALVLSSAAHRMERCWGSPFLKASQDRVAGGLCGSGKQGWADKGLVEVDSSDHLSLPTVPTRRWTALQ